MKKLFIFLTLIFLLTLSETTFAQGFCIKSKNSRLSVKATSTKSCPSGQAFIPTVAGASGPQGNIGATGPQGPAGSNGINGSARAYGFVSGAGNINTAKSTSNVSARKVSSGVYCLSATGIDPNTVMPVVSADQDDGSGSFHLAQIKSQYGSIFGCTASEWAVHTSIYSGGFTSSDVAFSFIVP